MCPSATHRKPTKHSVFSIWPLSLQKNQAHLSFVFILKKTLTTDITIEIEFDEDRIEL